MPPKRRKLNREAQLPTKVAVDDAGNPLPPQFDKPTNASLVTLPDEIQLMIYRYLLPTRQTIEPHGRLAITKRLRSGRRERPSFAIMRVSKTTHRLTASILYGENTFSFWRIAAFTQFIYKSSPSYRRFIHHLVFVGCPSLNARWQIKLNTTRMKDLRTLLSLKTLALDRKIFDRSTVNDERQHALEKISAFDPGLMRSRLPGLTVTVSAEWKDNRVEATEVCEHQYSEKGVRWDVVFDAVTETVTLGSERLYCCSCARLQRPKALA